jgi:hypothetical protein
MARQAQIYADELAAKERKERKMEMSPQAFSSRDLSDVAKGGDGAKSEAVK